MPGFETRAKGRILRATGRYVDDETRGRVLDDMGLVAFRRPSASQQAKQPVEPFDVLVTALEVYQRENGESTVPSTSGPNADPDAVLPRTTLGA